MDARRAWIAACLLLGLAASVQLWSILRAETPALDAIRYIDIAKGLETRGWRETLAGQVEHPLYPALVFAARRVLSPLLDGSPSLWVASAQAASAVMAALAVVPLFFLTLRLLGAGPALTAGVFYSLMPEIAHLGADALSDSAQLFFLACAIGAAAQSWDIGQAGSLPYGSQRLWLLAAGYCTGLAMLARTESCLALLAVCVALIAFQFHRGWRQRWTAALVCCGCTAAGWALAMAPYLWASNAWTPGEALCRALGRELPQRSIPDAPRLTAQPTEVWNLPTGERMAFGLKDGAHSSRFQGYRHAVLELLRELPAATNFWIGGLALAGFWLGRRLPRRPIDAYLAALIALYLAAVVATAARLRYLSTRHLLPLSLVCLPAAGYAACALGQGLSRLLDETGDSPRRVMLSGSVAAIAALACLPMLATPSHFSRAGHRQAGEWLASAPQQGAVLDSRGWTGLYSGRQTVRFDEAQAELSTGTTAYVVLERRELQQDSLRSRTLSHMMQSAANLEAQFHPPLGKREDDVLVYCWRSDRLAAAIGAPGAK